MIAPLDPFSEVVDENRRWRPDWYSWLKDLEAETAGIGAAVALPDTDNSHVLGIELGSDLTDNRTLTIITGDADRTLTIAGDATISGTNTGDQTITLTGDVTGTGTGSFATTIPAASVEFAQIQNIATDKLAGRDTPSSGPLEEIGVSGGIEFTGAGGVQTGAFTGDVTKAAGGTALTLANGAVTFAKRNELFKIVDVDATGTNTTAVQPWFPPTGAVDVAVGSYFVRGLLYLRRSNVTTNFHSFALAGTATLTGDFLAFANKSSGNISAANDGNWFIQPAVQPMADDSTGTDMAVLLEGTIRVTVAGTLIPQFKFSVNPGAAPLPIIFRGTYFRLTPIGDETVTEQGTWT